MARRPTDLEPAQGRAAPPEPSREQVLAGLAAARRLVAEGRDRDALAACRRLHSQVPADGEVLALLGLLHARLGDLEKGLAHLVEALLLAPGSATVLWSLA